MDPIVKILDKLIEDYKRERHTLDELKQALGMKAGEDGENLPHAGRMKGPISFDR